MAQNCISCGRKLGLLSHSFMLSDGSRICTDCAEEHFLYLLAPDQELPNLFQQMNKAYVLGLIQKMPTAAKLKQEVEADDAVQIANYFFDLRAGVIFINRTNDEHNLFYMFADVRSMRAHTKKQTYGRKHLVRNMTLGKMVGGHVGEYYAATHSPKKTIYNYLGEIVTFKDGSEHEFRAPVSTALIDSRAGRQEKQTYDYMVQVLKRGKAQFRPKKKRKPRAKTVDPAKEIKELAELQKQGIITQDEFDTKKKQLLGL